jgi:hypothetical protein
LPIIRGAQNEDGLAGNDQNSARIFRNAGTNAGIAALKGPSTGCHWGCKSDRLFDSLTVERQVAALSGAVNNALTGLRQRLADFLKVFNIGIVKSSSSIKRSVRVRVLSKRTGLVRIVETNGYIAFSEYLLQSRSNGPVPVDTILSQIRRLGKGISPIRRFFYQIPEKSDLFRIIRHEQPSEVQCI